VLNWCAALLSRLVCTSRQPQICRQMGCRQPLPCNIGIYCTISLIHWHHVVQWHVSWLVLKLTPAVSCKLSPAGPSQQLCLLPGLPPAPPAHCHQPGPCQRGFCTATGAEPCAAEPLLDAGVAGLERCESAGHCPGQVTGAIGLVESQIFRRTLSQAPCQVEKR
jgi:hypothetical protein